MDVRNRLSTAAVAALSATVLAACGSDGSGTTGVDGDTIKIGVSVTLSGPVASSGTATECGVRAYLEAVNEDGGVNGYQFEVTAKDNQYDPAIAATVARELATDGVFAVVVSGTSSMEASVPVLEARGIPVLGALDGALVTPPDWEGVFGYYPSYAKDGASAATFTSEELGVDEASVVAFSPTAEPAAEAFEETFEAAGGTVSASETLTPEVTDFAAMAQKLKSAAAPVVYAPLVDTQLAGLQKAADAIGYNPDWISWTISQGPTYQELAGDLSEGVYFSQWAVSDSQTDDPAVQDYLDAVEGVDGCANRAADAVTKTGYAQGAMIAYAVEQATEDGGEPTAEALIEELSSVEDQQFGLTPHVTYDDGSHAGIRYDSYWQVVDGQLELVRDFEPLPEG